MRDCASQFISLRAGVVESLKLLEFESEVTIQGSLSAVCVCVYHFHTSWASRLITEAPASVRKFTTSVRPFSMAIDSALRPCVLDDYVLLHCIPYASVSVPCG